MKGIGAALTGMIVVLLLRSTLLAGLAVRGLVLDVLVFSTVFWALRAGAGWGATFGFVVGLCADLDAAHWLGRHALGLSLLGYLVGRLSGTLVRDSAGTQLLVLALATAAHQAWSIAFELGGFLAWPEVLLRVFVGAIATGVLGAAVLAFTNRWTGPFAVPGKSL
jgi:rod shape-determining protein MreD